jgi:hypothetical protein
VIDDEPDRPGGGHALPRGRSLQGFHFDLQVRDRPVSVSVLRCPRALQEPLELLSKIAGTAGLYRHRVADQLQDVGQALLRIDTVEGLGIIPASPVRHHGAGIASWDHFLDFVIIAPGSTLMRSS